MSKKRRYTDEFRAQAVALLQSEGYPDQKGVLGRVAKQLGISYQILSNWIREVDNPPPQEILQEKKRDLRTLLQTEIDAIFEAMETKRESANYRDLATAGGIFLDKLARISGEPTDILELRDKRELSDDDLLRIASRGSRGTSSAP